MTRLYIGPDPKLISEMATTTESSDATGNKVYHPQKKDDEHNTDALRCIALAIRDLSREGDSETIFGGFVQQYGGVGVTSNFDRSWRPPWN